MLDTVKRALRAKDAADRIMDYRIAEYNDKVSKIVFDDIRDFLKADIEWLARVKKASTVAQFTFVRATTCIEVSQRLGGPKGDSREEFKPLIDTEYSRYRGNYGRRTDVDRAVEFLESPAGYGKLKSSPFTVPCEAFHGGRSVRYEDAVMTATQAVLAKLRETDGDPLIAEYKALVNMIDDTLAAAPNWAKLLVAWPDAAKYLPELEPEPKLKALIVPNDQLVATIKKYQPPKKPRSMA